MWWQLFIVLVATAAASEDDYEEHRPSCASLIDDECATDDVKPPDFPGNGEELEEFCKFAVNYMDCNERVFTQSTCEGDDFKRFVSETSANARRICNEDPLLRTAITANLPCFKENIGKIGSCQYTFSLDRESFNEAMNEIGVTNDEESDDPGPRCLNVLYGVGCIVATTSQLCGDVAKDIAINIIRGFDIPFETCPPGIKEKIPEIAEVMQMEAEKAESVGNKLKKKK